jgi:hypothetical protein
MTFYAIIFIIIFIIIIFIMNMILIVITFIFTIWAFSASTSARSLYCRLEYPCCTENVYIYKYVLYIYLLDWNVRDILAIWQ